MTNEDRYAATAWGSAPVPFEVELPSGQRCLVRKLQMEDVIRLNLIDALDTFSPQLMSDDKPEQPKTIKETMGLMGDPDKLDRLMESMDKVVVVCVVKPKVFHLPNPGEERVEGRAYIDYIGFEDKMTLFGEVFEGMSEAERFREEPTDGMGDVAAVEGSEPSPIANGGTTDGKLESLLL